MMKFIYIKSGQIRRRKIKMETATLIVPVDDIKLRTESMKSTVRSRKQKWTSYKRFSLKEVRKCLSTYSASL